MSKDASGEPVKLVVKQTVMGIPAKEIARQLNEMGINVTEKRVRSIQAKIGDEVFDVIRQEFMTEAASTIIDYRKQITTIAEIANKRFLEAQAAYEGYMNQKSRSFTELFNEFQQDPNPNIQDYVMRANALQEGMNIQKLSVVMKNISGDLAKWTEIAAKLDQRLGSDSVKVQVNIESMVDRVYTLICDDCKLKLADL